MSRMQKDKGFSRPGVDGGHVFARLEQDRSAGDIPRFLNTVRDYSSDRNLHFNLKPAAVQ